MGMPDERALRLDDHYVVSVELSDDPRRPMIRKGTELFGKVYGRRHARCSVALGRMVPRRSTGAQQCPHRIAHPAPQSESPAPAPATPAVHPTLPDCPLAHAPLQADDVPRARAGRVGETDQYLASKNVLAPTSPCPVRDRIANALVHLCQSEDNDADYARRSI
jgi:hypothetical protein